MLMMVDPDVHFHVLPRYEAEQTYQGSTFTDRGWPGPPNIGHDNVAADEVKEALLGALKSAMG
jgi:diadenosine tetraphosphate (Ap4A) HIT family hydrolase